MLCLSQVTMEQKHRHRIDMLCNLIIRNIILTIKTRGPEAFYKLIESLRQSDQNLLADILENTN